MLHELLVGLGPSTVADGAVPDGGSSIALYGLIGVVVTTIGAIIIARIQRGRAASDVGSVKLITVPESHLQDLIDERNKAQNDAKAAESQCDQTSAEAMLLRKGIGQLREALIRGITTDPDTVLTADVKAVL